MEMLGNKELVKLIIGWLARRRERHYAVIKITRRKTKETRY